MICSNFLRESCNCSCNKSNECLKSDDNRSVVTCEEKHKTYFLNNPNNKNIKNYHIDGGVIQNREEKKCDYLIYFVEEEKVILVELKGTNFDAAVGQIAHMLNILKSKLTGKRVYGRIVGRSVPKIEAIPAAQKLKKELKKLGGNLKAESNSMTETLADL